MTEDTSKETPATEKSAKRSASAALRTMDQNARTAALILVSGVLTDRRSLDDLWAEGVAEDGALSRLDTRDKAFARMLAATVLRRLGQIDALLSRFIEKPLPKEAGEVRHVLRLGVAQLLFMKVPDHAAVDEMVSLARPDRLRGLVNAVLRRVSQEGEAIVKAMDAPRINTPDWLWDAWCSAYGQTAARGIAEQHLEEPPLDLSVKEEPESWANRLDGELLSTGTLRRSTADPRNLLGFSQGAWWIQDVASALPVRLLDHVRNKTVIDLCAAPGGKTIQLALNGARVVSMDKSKERLKLVKENLDRMGLTASLLVQDVTQWRPDISPKLVLLDAPCSATGTIRRNPDIAHLKKPKDIAPLVKIQDAMLNNAFERLAPGGLLVYCTCSLQPEEGPERIEKLLETRADAVRDPIDPQIIDDFEEAVTRDGDLRTLPCIWPEKGGMDGFFAARIRKKAKS